MDNITGLSDSIPLNQMGIGEVLKECDKVLKDSYLVSDDCQVTEGAFYLEKDGNLLGRYAAKSEFIIFDKVNDKKYQTILKDSIGKIDVFNNTIGPIDGYDSNKYEFLLSGDKFISDYQRRVYNIDINKKDRIDYLHGTFNYNVFRDYLPEGLRCYMIDRKLLKIKNIELYKYIEEVLHERK